jgi:DnaD/phage-associated family protein
MRQVEKEGYYWARLGLFDQDSAAAYLKTCAQRDEQMGAYMQVLGLGNRRPVESEERYIRSWMDKGFDAEAVALAYDKTVFYKKELNWRYLNGILRRWDEQGWHTAEEVRGGDEKKPAAEQKTGKSNLDKYMNW